MRLYSIATAALLIAVTLAGCPQPPEELEPAEPQSPLRLLVVDDPALGQAIARQYQADTEQTLEVKAIAAADVIGASRLPGDMIVFPSGLVGHLIEQDLVVPLDGVALANPEFNRRDIFAQIRLREITWGNRTVAVPLGSPQLLLAYRSDIFERLSLAPPTDWTEYQQAIEKLADREALGDLAQPADQPWRAAVEPLAGGWAGHVLLARSAAYAMHRDQVSPLLDRDTAEPRIAAAPYARSLKELAAAATAAGFADQRLTPRQALDEVRQGRAAMALAWPSPERGREPETTDTGKSFPIRFALLPGARQSYNLATKRWDTRSADEPSQFPTLAVEGRMGAVASNAADRKQAEGFLLWLAGGQASRTVSPQSFGTTLFRQSQVADPAPWTGDLSVAESKQYAETIAAALSLPRAFPGMRLPGRIDYLAALDEAVHKAVSGEATPADALAAAAARWTEITTSLGVEKQKLANRRSLGQADLP
jgi:multiple sugar transport system substrate-binding protein